VSAPDCFEFAVFLDYTCFGVTEVLPVKTITVKADNEFDAILNQLASRLHTTRSGVIRDAVKNYLKYIDREALRKQVKAASLKTREQAKQASVDFNAVNNDGL
jgi:predicted transcriptional regulator